MKKLFTLLTLIILSTLIFTNTNGQVVENFDAWTDNSYGTIDTYTNPTTLSMWESNKALTETANSISGKCVRLRNQSGSSLTYKGLDGNGKDGGVGTISFWYRSWDSSPAAEYFVAANIDGAGWVNIGSLINTTSTTYQLWSHDLNSSSDNILIKIERTDGERLKVDDFNITELPTSDTNVKFNSLSSSVNEDGTSITVCVEITNPDATAATTVEIGFDGLSTATNGTDFSTISFPVTLTFPAGSSTDECLLINITDDGMEESSEDIIMFLQNPAGGTNAVLGATVDHTVTIIDNDGPQPGDIVINEYMAAPSCSDEYVELYNTTSNSIDINGWTLKDDGIETHVISNVNGTTIIPAMGYLLLAKSSATDITPDYTYSFTLANGGDEIILLDGSTEICRVDYTDGNEFGTGVSNQLPENYDYSLADDGVIMESEFTAPNTTYGCGDFGTPKLANILPVDLISLQVCMDKNTSTISWSTSSEINNSHFNVQHSVDGERFQTIGEVEGNGNSNRLNSYSFDHNAPTAGLNYYRLEQVDYDGAKSYSKIVKTNNSTSYTRNHIIQSNVVSNDIFLNVDEFTTVQVKDMSGKTIVNASIAQAGSINVSNLNAGMYLVVFNTNGVINTEKIIKQ